MSELFPEPSSRPPQGSFWVTWLSGNALQLLLYLNTDDIVQLGRACSSLRQGFLNRSMYRQSVLKSGPTDQHRFGLWKKSLRVEEMQREVLTRENSEDLDNEGRRTDICFALYRSVLHGSEPAADASGVIYSGKRMLHAHGQEGEILRDVTRTFPTEALFRDSAGVGQNLLANVLKACLYFHDDVGYCQGMNYVVATLLFSLRRKLLPPSSLPTPQGPSSPNSTPWPLEASPKLGSPCPSPCAHGEAVHVPSHEHDGYCSDHSMGSHHSVGSTASLDLSPGKTPYCEKAAKKCGYKWECTNEQMALASEVFWVMTAIMGEHSGLNMRMLWHPEVPHMKLRVFQFDRILEAHAPRLHAHFKVIRLAPDILVSQWLTTLLAYCLPPRVLVRVWDMCFLDGWKALFRICLALLLVVQEDMLLLNLEEAGRFLRQWTSKRHPLWRDPKCLLHAASKLKITRSMLEKLREEFRLTLLKEQLAGANGGEWLCRYGPGSEAELLASSELEGLKRDLDNIQKSMSQDVMTFRKKIENASDRFNTAKRRVDDVNAYLLEATLQIEELEEVKDALQSQMERIISLCNRNYASPVPPGASSEPCQVQQDQQQIREEGDSEEDGEQDTGGGATVLSVSTMPEALESSQGSKWSRTLSSSSTVHDQLDVQTPQQQEACRHLYQDLYVQEKKVSRATEQLACLRLQQQILKQQQVEAQLALDEMDMLRAAASTQLIQVLQETEERVNRKMREVISQQPSAHTDAPTIRSPNKQAIQSDRSRGASQASPTASVPTLPPSSPIAPQHPAQSP